MSHMVSEGVRLPNILDAYPRQDFPASLLTPYMGKWRVLAPAADQFEAFAAAVKAELGFEIRPVKGSASAYRSLREQINLFHERYSPGRVAGRKQKTYKGVVYSLNPRMSDAAVPADDHPWGGSIHGWALAIDFCRVGPLGQDIALTWAENQAMRPIAARFGIASTASTEPWHWACQNADIVIGVDHIITHEEAQELEEWVFGDGGDHLIEVGESGPEVTFVQVAVNKYASQNLDGDQLTVFGSKTKAAVANVQLYIHNTPASKGGNPDIRTDGLVDEVTWNTLRWITVANGGTDFGQ